MRYRFAADCHTHSNCSPDGHEPAESMLRRAGELGLYAYALTDHCECQAYEQKYRASSQRSWQQMTEAMAHCPEGLRFYRGVELGQPMQDLSAAEEVVLRDYDFVIGSLHNVADEKDFYYMGWGQAGADPDRWDGLFTQYFRELTAMVSWGKFDTLAHITYPLRYLSAPDRTPSFDAHQEELDAVLSALAKADIALEMNTSRLCRPGAPHLPDLEVFTRFRELGGKLVTLGSDAHDTERLASGLDEGMDILKAAGFTEFAVYEKRQPMLLPLE